MRPAVGIGGAGAQRPASRVRARSPAGPGASPQVRQGQGASFNFQSPGTRGGMSAARSGASESNGLFLAGAGGAASRAAQGTAPRQRDSRLIVVVRKRPMNRRELQAQQQDVVLCRNSAVIVREPKLKVDLTKYVEEHNFLFDESFDENVSNEHLYDACVRPVIDAVFGGAKCTCFAYGQTGSGKTFTMMGPHKRQIEGVADSERTPGIFLLASRDLFRGLSNKDFGHLGLYVAFYEIYCGKLFDLLNNRQILHARENAKANVVIVGLQEHAVKNVQDLMEVIDLGLSSRTTGVTGANVDSSRSHAILQISLKDGRSKDQDGKLREHGKISFIDLAGSERGADTMDTDRQTRMDGAEINKSLLALKECIRALDQQHDHTPFRGSKLTQVLKDSFVGSNCRTVMIANVSPCGSAVEHSLNTLRYAYRVKELRSGSKVGLPGVADSGGPLADEPPSAQPSLPLGARASEDGYCDADYDSGGAVSAPAAMAPGGPELRSPRPATGALAPPGAVLGNGAAAAAAAAAGVAPQPHMPPQGVQQQQHLHMQMQQQHQQQQHLHMQQHAHEDGMQQRRSVGMGGPPLPLGGSARNIVAEAWAENAMLNSNIAGHSAAVGSTAAIGGRGDAQHQQQHRHAAAPEAAPAEVALEPGAGPGGCSQAALDELARQHDRLIGTILAEEEELITAHRQHIDMMVELIKEEMLHLNNVDRPGSDVDAYVSGLDRILRLKAEYIGGIRQRVDTFKEHLQQEDTLSKKFQSLATSSSS